MPLDERRFQTVSAIFAAALGLLGITLAVLAILVTLYPDIRGVSYIENRFHVAFWINFAAVLGSALLAVLSLNALIGRNIPVGLIVWTLYTLIGLIVAGTFFLCWVTVF